MRRRRAGMLGQGLAGEEMVMMQFDPATGSLVLPIWGSAALAAVVLVLAILAVLRSGALRTLAALIGLAAVGYAGWVGSTALEHVTSSDRQAERRAFEMRAQELVTRALLPGSPLSCLDDGAGEQVALNCEKVVFGSPENVAAAVSYVTARVSMLIDGLDAAGRDEGDSYEGALNALRRGLESDRYGVVAHVFLQQANCQPENCEALSLLRDPDKVRANLHDKTFDTLVARHATGWTQSGAGPSADAAKSGTVAASPGANGIPISSKYDFPSAASIPPVSIMNTEPPPPATAPATTSSAAAAPAPAKRRSPPPARAPAPRQAAQSGPAPAQHAPAAPAAPANGGARPAAQ